MKTVDLLDYFDEIGYDWNKDFEKLDVIMRYTKTRPKKIEYSPSAGQEQTYLLKGIAENIGATSFFEIGTGRGTACYALSLIPEMEQIITVDIISHYQKKNEAIENKPAVVSNYDLYNMIPYEEKQKISFKHTSDMMTVKLEMSNEFDMAFIDGNHTSYDIVMQDFNNCLDLVKPGGVIVFDDYHPQKFVVKNVVNDILLENPDIEACLVCVTGHLFEQDKRKEDSGLVVFKIPEE